MSASSKYSDTNSGVNQGTSSGFVTGVQPSHPGDQEEPMANIDDAYSSDSDEDDVIEQPPTKSNKPGNNAFRQQRLKAYNPVFTAKMVVPLLLVIALIFIPLGAAMWLASHRIEDFAIDYSHCELLANRNTFTEIPDEYLQYNLKNKNWAKPQWKLATDEDQDFEDERNVCQIQFNLAEGLKAPIYLFYRLEKFHANHRRYVISFSEEQIIGHAASEDTVKHTSGQNCQPMSTNDDGKIIYPCGLIANSLFNDTFSHTLTGVNGTSDDYKMTNKGIAWKSDANRFKKTEYSPDEVVPPPNWYKKYPKGYTEDNMPNVETWEEFQNWMHPAGLPTFNKLALRNDDDELPAGTYQIEVGLHFPVLPFKGGKYIYISQRSVMGGKNYFLGYSWIAGGGCCFILAIALLIVNVIKPRKTGDVNLLSWNRESFKANE
ncbi:alkylphosphocholine resistance protein Lem3p [[Candida] jaroonii]|uniref:Alkylphosphocholine resistance protein Lem3p n=1 Tax=[Candida] jaroonii TaxID=467808 RepID=A0ACA9Y6E5_9ASCO|nr:alkylphosphocholine resistance protein Lem3p [[Candida] jaroonii]